MVSNLFPILKKKDKVNGIFLWFSQGDFPQNNMRYSLRKTHPSVDYLRISFPSFNHVAVVVEVAEAELHPVVHVVVETVPCLPRFTNAQCVHGTVGFPCSQKMGNNSTLNFVDVVHVVVDTLPCLLRFTKVALIRLIAVPGLREGMRGSGK